MDPLQSNISAQVFSTTAGAPPFAAGRPSLDTIPPEITSKIIELSCIGASTREVRYVALVSCEFAAVARPFLRETVDLSTASLSALAHFLEEQAPQHGRLVRGLRLSDNPTSRTIPSGLETLAGVMPPTWFPNAGSWRSSLFAAILPLLPNLRRLSCDVSVDFQLEDDDPLNKALVASAIWELVITRKGSHREVDNSSEFGVLPHLIEHLPNLERLTFRITFPTHSVHRIHRIPANFAPAMTSLRKPEHLAIVGDFELVNHESVQGLQNPLKELVLARGPIPGLMDLLVFLRRFEGTLERVRIPDVAEDSLPGRLQELRNWCAEKGISLELADETEWDYIAGYYEYPDDLAGEEAVEKEDLEEPVWGWSEDELVKVESVGNDEGSEWEDEEDGEEDSLDSE